MISKEDWMQKRLELLKKEKEFTRQRDELTSLIRGLPLLKVEKSYSFGTENGAKDLESLFQGSSQLAVYHFMLGPNWEQGCKSCSFWADNFNGISNHLKARDISFIVVSRAPLKKILKFKNRMGWSFEWVSSFESDFNFDFNVSFKDEDIKLGQAMYNYRETGSVADEMPGASFFIKKGDEVFHSYSTYGRGLDILNGAYNWLDLCPKGRDESELDYPMSWVKHHDQYGE